MILDSLFNAGLETKDIVSLRPIEREDLEFLRDLANESEVRRNVVGWGWPLSLADQERWFNSGIDTPTTRRLIVEASDGQPIGMTGLWEIDWRNRSAMVAIKLGGGSGIRGKGLGEATIRFLMEFAFRDVGLRRLHASFLTTNEASRALFLRKCGWIEEGVMRQHVWRDGQFRDVIQVGILESEYEQQRGAKP